MSISDITKLIIGCMIIVFLMRIDIAKAHDDGFYIMFGQSYKFNEPSPYVINGSEKGYGHWMGCMLEAGYEWHMPRNISIKSGYAHHSQCFSGKPFNDDNEYYKDELFIHTIFRF